jgi:hypothetical protein
MCPPATVNATVEAVSGISSVLTEQNAMAERASQPREVQ